MKPLNLKETALKEEMKKRCLAKGQYIDENAKAKFDMLCHLEDFEVQYWELQKENKQLKDNWNKLKEYITYWIIFYNETIEDGWINLEHEKEDLLNRQIREEYKFLLCKMETLEQGGDSNE